jgi:phosphatidylinositol alpha 1,6-mannosyltransferase
VVHLASPALLGYGGLRAARYLKVPTVAVFQTDIAGFAESYGAGAMSRAAWAWTRHLHSQADRTLAPSTSAMENLAAHRIPRVHRWGRGVDITGFVPSARDQALRARWSPDGKPVIGFVGRLAPEKHVERLAVLAARDDLQIVIVGDGIDRGKLESLMPAAVFTGELRGERLAAAYASMDVFVHPGEHETFCQAVQEAMASGVPVIAPNAGGPRDLVAPMHTGLLLDVPEFQRRLPAAVEHLIAERPRYSTAARRSVLSRTWPAVCAELLGHYDAVRGARAARAA